MYGNILKRIIYIKKHALRHVLFKQRRLRKIFHRSNDVQNRKFKLAFIQIQQCDGKCLKNTTYIKSLLDAARVLCKICQLYKTYLLMRQKNQEQNIA